MKGRTGLVILVILIIAGIVVYLVSTRPGGLFGREEPGLPVDLARVIPPEWQVPPDAPPQCSFDDDPDLEWLVRYRYNTASVTRATGEATEPLQIGPWGAAIFDVQAENPEELRANPGPYRPTELIPYKLLPDFYPGKGQGYLGETSTDVFFVPQSAPGPDCEADEINVLGYGNAELPTRISIFKWGGATQGYLSAHMAGNARVEVQPAADSGNPINTVITYDRLDNHRSLLCEVRTFKRYGFAFTMDAAVSTIDFCYGPPPDPYYPEGVFIAVLRNHQPSSTAPNALPLDSYLFGNAEVDEGVTLSADPPLPVIRLRNPSDIQVSTGQGSECTTAQIPNVEAGQWWCGRERTVVTAEAGAGSNGGAPQRLEFTLASVLPMTSAGDIHWRVERIRLAEP